MSLTFVVVLLAAAAPAAQAATPTGPYKTSHSTYSYDAMDLTNKHIDVCMPAGQPAGSAFPLISYAHGFGDKAYESYVSLWEELASWGYVVAGPLSCEDGCLGDCQSHFLDPPCYQNYYLEQLKVIEWALKQTDLPINRTSGVAIAGHSMGGQATLFSAAYNGTTHNIRAAAMHHAYTHQYPAVTETPFLTFTGTADPTAPPKMANDIFNAPGAFATRGLINKKGADHHEPTTHYNVQLAHATVAWFKIHVDRQPESMGKNFTDYLYGTGADSLCHGADGEMAECDIRG